MTEANQTFQPWPAILSRLIVREGGYCWRENDRGGPTNFGITQATLSDAWGQEVDAQAVRDLTLDDAREIYWRKWICHPACRYSLLPLGSEALEAILDCAVLFGRARANKWTQELTNALTGARLPEMAPIAVDGVVGPATRNRLTIIRDEAIPPGLALRRLARHAKRCAEDPSQLEFMAGWTKRALEVAGVLGAGHQP